MGSAQRDKYFSVENCSGSVQTTLDPAFNENIASKVLDKVQENVSGVDVVGGYLTGSSAYGLAINEDSLVNQLNNEDMYEGSDIDLYVLVTEDETAENKDFVSDSYDLIDEAGEHIDHLPGEVNPIVIREKKFLGALKTARNDWEDSADTEYVELPHPKGERSHKYSEFIESLKKRLTLGGISSSPVEKELSMGERALKPHLRQNGSKVKKYVREQYDERKKILRENMQKGRVERSKHRNDEFTGDLGQLRSKTSLKNVLESEFDLEDIENLVKGEFGDLELREDTGTGSCRSQSQLHHFDQEGRQARLYNYGGGILPEALSEDDITDLVNGILDSHPEVEVEEVDSRSGYVIGGSTFEDSFGPEEIIYDAVNSIIGKSISEIQVDFNPADQEIDELVSLLQEGTEKEQTNIADWN